jgi:hypothetical protein
MHKGVILIEEIEEIEGIEQIEELQMVYFTFPFYF